MTIPAALTPDEWRSPDKLAARGWTAASIDPTSVASLTVRDTVEVSTAPIRVDPLAQHALAALCLHNHAYGFQRSDVVLLRAMGNHEPDSMMPANWLLHSKDLANRIEALLPLLASTAPPSAPAKRSRA